jgi:succinate-semialdehyde dehydrogenase / glutarate-semialdehyde dehydrogenase
MALQAINPATRRDHIQTYDEMTPGAVREAITQAHTTFQDWRHTTFADRARVMQRAAHVLRENANDYAVLMAQEMGKPIRDGRAEAEKCAWV